MEQWNATHELFTSHAGAITQLGSVGSGVVDVQWSRDSRSILSVQGDYLFIGPASGQSTRIAGPLFDTLAPPGYYGQVGWDTTFAWHQG
jgi:hypothetical protein